MITVFKECFNIVTNVLQVLFFFLLFLTFIHSFCLINIFSNWSFLLISSVPVFDTLYSFNGTELFIIYISVMSNSDKWLVNISLWEKNALSICYRFLVLIFKLSTKFFNFFINQDCWNYTQWHNKFDWLNCIVVSVHTNICEEVNVWHKIIKFVSVNSEKLWNFTIILSSKRNFSLFSFFFCFWIVSTLFIIIHSSILHFKFES